MREHRFHRAKWLIITICCVLNSVSGDNSTPAWSKPEKSISPENNDWIPVQGKCPTCRANRDLDAQSTNEHINQVLSPPAPQQSRLVSPQPSRSPSLQPLRSPSPTPKQLLQFPTQKQTRMLPFGSSFPTFNSPFFNGDNKPYQLQATKLFPQEPQKQFYQYETSSFIKQPYSLPPQQLIQQSPALVQQQISQQRFPGINEPYPFTLPLKSGELTTPKATYQPKIRFPEAEVPKFIPNNKITAQNTDEIQLLYVPVETLQRGRKNMKEQFPPTLQQSFITPQYNLPYQQFSAQPESQFYFPQGYSPPPNFIQQPQTQVLQVPQQPQKSPETIQTNASKNIPQPYFTINSIYNNVPPANLQNLPPKQQADLQFINLLQAGLINPNQLRVPEQQFKTPAQIRPGQFEINNLSPEKAFILQSNADLQNNQATFNDPYTPTTTESAKTTQFLTEKSTFASKQPTTKLRDFDYQYVTSSPQTSASQNQQYVFEQNVLNLPKQVPQQLIPQLPQQRLPQTKLPGGFEEGNSNYPVPHQPPLSFYMEKLHNSKINDVLYLLKDAKTIPVLDAVEQEPPQVFVGPSELQPPKGYIKFELPYLSSLDYNRIEKMVDRLPFFVAPLNFKPPPGYSKIPFPAPHIGSVVLSNSTAVHEALHGKPTEQKYKPTSPPFPTTEFSTTNPQLTSQINSLVETPLSAPVGGLSFKNTFEVSPPALFEQTFKPFSTPPEEITKKPLVPTKITYKPPISTEQPKRVTNRQRKPIYRGYPTTTTTTTTTTEQSTTQFTTTTEPTRKAPEFVKDTDNYVEFAAKGNFNINNGNQPVNPVLTIENAFQQQPPSTTFQPPFQSDKTFDISNFFSTFGNQQSPPKQNIQFPSSDFQSVSSPQNNKFEEINSQFQNSQFQNSPQPTQQQFQQPQFENSQPVNSQPTQNFINENSFQTSKQQSSDYFNPRDQNNQFFNPQQTTNEVTTEAVSSQPNNTQQESQSVNFSNIKPLSQYNPFVKNEETPQNVTEATTSSTTSQSSDNFSFWNQQNQFYNSNPAAVEFFSSPSSFPSSVDTSASTASETKPDTPATTTTSAPESAFGDSQRVSQSNDFSSIESTEKPSTNGYRSRIKQRIQPSRYHQVKHTTEKENIDYQYRGTPSKSSNTDFVIDTSSQSTDTISQSTESPETTTKHRRRRPIKPHVHQVSTESTSASTRGYRTRPNRYQTGSSTERYRARRPTVPNVVTSPPETASSEWVGFGGNNLAPSAPGTNEITPSVDNQQRIDDTKTYSKPATQFWTEPRNQPQSNIDAVPNPSTEDSLKTVAPGQNTVQEVLPAWSDGQKTPFVDQQQFTPFVPPAQNQQFFIEEQQSQNTSDNAAERKDEHQFENKQVNNAVPQTFEEISSTSASVTNRDSIADSSVYPSEKTYDQDIRKDKFLLKDGADGQKKAYDPQDEKKVSL